MKYLTQELINNLIDNCGQYKFKFDRVSRFDWETNNFNQGAAFLYLLIHDLKPKILIELGTFEAHGTMLFYEAVKYYRSSIITIDWDKEINTSKEDYQLISKARQDRIKKANRKGGKIRFISGDTRIVLKNILPKIKEVDFVFQDSMHFVPGLLEEFDLLRPYLSKNGVIVFDDWWMIKLKYWFLFPYLKARFSKNISANPLKNPIDMIFNWFEINRGKGFLIGQRIS